MTPLRKAITKTAALAILLASSLAATPALADMQAWQKSVVQLISKNQNYPRAAAVKKEEGVTRVRLTIDAGGAITAVEIAGASGSETLDREAERMFQKIGSFPAPPNGQMTLVVPVVWKLN
jgi:TonB family protein